MSRVRNEIQGDYLEVERIEGNLMYVKGHKYPIKGVPTVEKVEKANEIKRAIKHLKSLKNIYIPVCYLGDFAEEIRRLVLSLTGDNHLAECIAFVLEYDQAYRFRLQDLFTETTKEKLKNPREVLRLSKIHKQRDNPEHSKPNNPIWKGAIHRKLRYLFWFVTLYAFFNLKKWRKAIEQTNFKNLQFDNSDIYWAKMKTDYQYGCK